VEPTPPSGRPNFKHRWGTAETWLDRITQFFRKTLADMRRGYFARAIINFVKAPFLFLPLITDTPSGGILAFFAVLLSGFLYYRRKKRHKATKPVRYPPELRLLRNDYKKFERKVTGATGVRRPSRATISEWALLLPDNKALREALRAYQKLRYRERSPSKTEIREFKKICGKALHGLRRRSFKDSG
jgi:hypothetical protein